MASGRDSRWQVLSLSSLGFLTLTWNWFDITPAFSAIQRTFHVGLTPVALLVALFVAGYGVFHIPTGLWARRWGLRSAVVVGLVLESGANAACALVPDFVLLAVLRFVAGIGGALVAGAEFALVSSFFPKRQLALAEGISGSAVYALGAVLGMVAWPQWDPNLSWRTVLILASSFGFIVAWLHHRGLPQGPIRLMKANAVKNTYNTLWRVFRNHNLWWVGLSTMGGYGAYFTVTQLMATYSVHIFHVTDGSMTWMGLMITLAGIPGALIGGLWSDWCHSRKWFIIIPLLILGVAFAVLPWIGLPWVWLISGLMGFLLIFGRPAYTAVPGDEGFVLEEVALAEGFILTLLAVGGFLVPLGFGYWASHQGYASGWVFLSVVTISSALAGLKLSERHAQNRHLAQLPVRVMSE